MSFTINTGKELDVAKKPVCFCDFVFPDGTAWHIASIAATFGGNTYEARIDDQQMDRIAYISEQGIDRVPSVTLSIADPTGTVESTYEDGHGFKDATLTLQLALMDPQDGSFSTDSFVPFVGVCDKPGSDDERLTVTANSKLNLSNYMLPTAPIQPRCLWTNPITADQRAAAASADSLYFPCGETRDLVTAPPCDYTRQTCTQQPSFSGVTYRPKPGDTGINYLTGNKESWQNADTTAKYRAYWPVWLGGKAWLDCTVLCQQGDGNYTRGEAAVGIGEVLVSRVVVNGKECSEGGKDFFWGYSNNGARHGTPNLDIASDGTSDPHGGQTVVEWRVPKAVADPASTANVLVLGERSVDGHSSTPSSIPITSITAGSGGNPGPIVIHFGRLLGATDPGDGSSITISGAPTSSTLDANGTWTMRLLELPYDHATLQGSWGQGSRGSGGTLYYNQSTQSGGGPTPGIIQEAMRLCGVTTGEWNGTEVATGTAICNGTISTVDGSGNTYSQQRFTSAVAVKDRRSVADIVRGLRQSIGAIITFDNAGLITMRVEGPLAEQQSAAVDGSNDSTPIPSTLRDGTVTNGYTAYRFDTETNCEDLKRKPMPRAQLPNRVTFGFQDPTQEYAQSTFSLVDSDDSGRAGREVPGSLAVQAEGIASYNHALRYARLGMAKLLRGNPAADTKGTRWWAWKTSLRGCKLRVGHIVTMNDIRRSLSEQQIRLTEIKPGKNFETVELTGHDHHDDWYLDSHGNAADPQFTGGGASHVGTGPTVPPTFGVEVYAPDVANPDTVMAEVTGLAFSDTLNTFSITAGTWTFYYVIVANPLTTLAANVGSSDATMTLTDASGVSDGDYIQLGREVVLCGAPSGSVVPITRGALASLTSTASSGDSVWLVQSKVQTVAFPLDFVNSPAFGNWKLLQPLPNTRLVAVGGSVTNSYGESPVGYVALTDNADHGLLLTPSSGSAQVTFFITNGSSSPSLSGAGTTGSPFILPPEAATFNIVATSQDVFLELASESSMVGVSQIFNLAAGSTHFAWLRVRGGDDLEGASTDYRMSTPGAVTVTGL
jgi:hypothetical protein